MSVPRTWKASGTQTAALHTCQDPFSPLPNRQPHAPAFCCSKGSRQMFAMNNFGSRNPACRHVWGEGTRSGVGPHSHTPQAPAQRPPHTRLPAHFALWMVLKAGVLNRVPARARLFTIVSLIFLSASKLFITEMLMERKYSREALSHTQGLGSLERLWEMVSVP